MNAIAMLAIFAAYAVPAAPKAPFDPPISAKTVEKRTDGCGWTEHGVMPVSLANAEGQMSAALGRSGWSFVHRVPMPGRGNGVVCSFKRGGKELVLMLWRLDVGKTGYSWGIAEPEKKGAKNETRDNRKGGAYGDVGVHACIRGRRVGGGVETQRRGR